jgi:biotin carboxyl carrier protein
MKYIVEIDGTRHTVELAPGGVLLDGKVVRAHLAEVPHTPVCVLNIADGVHAVRLRRRNSRGSYALWIDGYRFEAEALDERTRKIRDLDLASNVQAGPAPLLAPMPGLVVRVLVSEGETVEPGQGLVVVEAMKMENELRAASAGRVATVHARPGSPVEKGTLLIEMANADT